jgi:hypothetical protein
MLENLLLVTSCHHATCCPHAPGTRVTLSVVAPVHPTLACLDLLPLQGQPGIVNFWGSDARVMPPALACLDLLLLQGQQSSINLWGSDARVMPLTQAAWTCCYCRGSGAALIKWAQWASSRPDLFPADFCEHMETLQVRAEVVRISSGHLLRGFAGFEGQKLDGPWGRRWSNKPTSSRSGWLVSPPFLGAGPT